MGFHHIANESQAPAFSPERSFSDTGKVGVLVKPVLLENCHHTRILHFPVLHNGCIDQLACIVHAGVFSHVDLFEHFCYGEHGTGVEKTGEVVTGEMFIECIIRNITDVHLQLFQIFDAEYLLSCFRIGNDKIAEAEVILDCFAKILRKCFRVFVDKNSVLLMDIFSVLRLG